MASFERSGRTAAFLYAFSSLSLTSSAQGTGNLWANSTALSLSLSATASLSSSLASTAQSSSSRAETNSRNVGDFIAAGLGMTHSMDTVEESLSTTPTSTTDSGATTLNATISSAPITMTPSTGGNVTLSFTGDCWEQWSSYWSANSSASQAWTRITVPTTLTYTGTALTVLQSYETFSGTTTVTVMNGVFPQTTFTTVTDTSVSYHASTGGAISTYTRTFTRDDGYVSSWNGTLIQPTCVLPSRIPECQSSWENWVAGKYEAYPTAPTNCASYQYKDVSLQPSSCQAPLSTYSIVEESIRSKHLRGTPSCTQASITGAVCSTLVDSYLKDVKYYDQQTDGVVAGGMNYTTYTTTDTSNSRTATITSNVFFWDPSSSFAPGCTLGCHSCQINGGTVQLIYWPPASSTYINGNYSAITRSSNETLTVVTLGTTLTSPTVYVSFDSLYAQNSCSKFGKTYYNEIVAITKTANLSSHYGWQRYNGLGLTASFNFTDLYVSPVPDYIYQSQPRCASSMAMFDPRRGNPLTAPKNWTCPRTAPYEPNLVMPIEVLQIDPEWANCGSGFNGFNDPPIALTPMSAIAVPTSPNSGPKQTEPAVPASSPKPTAAPITSSVDPVTPPETTSVEAVHNSAPDSSRVIEASDTPETNDGQASKHDPSPSRQTVDPVMPSRSTTDPAANTIGRPTEDPASTEHPPDDSPAPNDPSQHKSVDPGDQSPKLTPDPAPEPTTDALSVLLEAQSSIDAATNHQSQASPVQSPDSTTEQAADNNASDPSSDDPKSTAVPEPMVMTMSDGGPITIHEASGSIVVQHDGSSVTAAHDSEITVGTHVFSAASDGSAIVIDNSATHTLPSPVNQPPALATFAADGGFITASRQGSAVVLAGETQTWTAPAGSAVTIGSQNVEIATDGQDLVVGSSTIRIPAKAHTETEGSTAVWTSGSSTYTAIAQGASVILQGPSITATLAAGETSSLAGEVFGVPESGGILVHGESTLTLTSGDTASAGSATTLVQEGETLIASAIESAIVVQEGTSSVTLSAGQGTVINGHTLSAAQGSDGLVVDGSKTVLSPTDVSTESYTGSATTLIQDGQTLIASATDNAIVIQQGTSTITLTAEQSTVIDGHTLSAAKSGAGLVVDGTKTVLSPTDTSEKASTRTSGTSADRSSRSTSATDVADATTNGAPDSETSTASSDSGSGVTVNSDLRLLIFGFIGCLWTGLALTW